MKLSTLVLVVAALASTAAFADAGDRPDQVFGTQTVTAPAAPATSASAPVASKTAKPDVLPVCFVNPYCGGA